jgi:hypothetical protein
MNMKTKSAFIRSILAWALFSATCRTNSPQNTGALCDRACLEGFADRYLEALTAHDPARLPLAKNVRYTENGQTLKLGDGMWGPVSGIGNYRVRFSDPQAGQIGFFAVLEENGHPAVAGIRLKVEDRKIREIEAVIARKAQDSWGKPETLVDQPEFRAALAPSEHRPRNELIAIANSYFEGLEKATDKLTPFEKNCTRIENGNVTANNPKGDNPIQKMTAGEQFATGFSKFITRIRERRFPVVDEERGLVYAIVFFDHAGTVTKVRLANGFEMKVPPPYDTPYTFLIGELFKIVDGKIARIEAVLLPVPYGMPSGWGPQG